MMFPHPLEPGKLLRRYKRFLADVRLADGQEVTAHCANPGRMLGLLEPEAPVWLSPAANPTRKLRWSWELVEADGGLVGINTAWPNRIAREGIEAGAVPELTGYPTIRPEVRYGRNSRIDLLLEGEGRPPCYVEVKNVHLRRNGDLAEFPDAVTARGAKHLVEMADMVAQGARAVMFYLVQRMDCRRFALAEDIDPGYAEAFRRARAAGVEALCYDCDLTPQGIQLRHALALEEPSGS